MKKKVFIMFGLALVCLSLFVSCNFGDSKKEPTEIQKEPLQDQEWSIKKIMGNTML